MADLFKNLTVVCAHCNHSETDGAHIELNFRDLAIYYLCPKCKKRNQLDLRTNIPAPYPKSRLAR